MALVFAWPVRVESATWTWDGRGVDNNWTTANNWNPNSVPANDPSTAASPN
jgi:hypothetical protein